MRIKITQFLFQIDTDVITGYSSNGICPYWFLYVSNIPKGPYWKATFRHTVRWYLAKHDFAISGEVKEHDKTRFGFRIRYTGIPVGCDHNATLANE